MNEINEYNRKKRIMVALAYAAIALAIYFIIFRYLIYIAWPFVIALLVAVSTRRPVLWASKKLHIPQKGAAALMVAVVYVLLAGIIVFGVLKGFWAIANWCTDSLPGIYHHNIEPIIGRALEWISTNASKDADSLDYLATLSKTIMDKMGSIVSWFSTSAVSWATKFATSLPKTLIGVIFMIISSFFIAMDYDKLSMFVMNQLKPNQQQILVSGKEYLGAGIGKLIVSYLLIMLITFAELNIGLRILDIANPTVVALIIAIFDILPALGTGGIVIPWIIIEVIKGNYKLALGLFIMYVIITVVRNVIEPKIVGDNIGVHPVLMLMSIYLGAYLLGPLGIIIMPFTIIVISRLNESGLIHIYNSKNE